MSKDSSAEKIEHPSKGPQHGWLLKKLLAARGAVVYGPHARTAVAKMTVQEAESLFRLMQHIEADIRRQEQSKARRVGVFR